MIRHRSSRYLGAFLALVSMLCMQLAMAAYVCPGMETADTQAMSHCDGMDMQQPVLCQAHTHDQGSKQTADQPELPVVQPFIAVQLHLLTLIVDDTQTASIFPAPELLAHATAPPLSIQYCCFRI